MGESEQVGGGGKSLKKWKAEKAHITQSEIDDLESVDISLFMNKAIASTAKELNISEEEIRKVIGEEEKVSKMAKRRQIIKIRLPRYDGNSFEWRKAIHGELIKASTDIVIREQDRIELEVTLYFDSSAVHWHDLDNRLKDIMDALQGRLGGPKSIKPKHPIIPNDNQVYKVNIEKFVAPKQSLGKGHLVVKKYVRRNGDALR